MMPSFTQTFTAEAGDIDVLGHVNNAVWVQWMEAIAVAHWEAGALPEQVGRYVWVVTRHEIDYRGNIAEGETVHARTFIPEDPQGARFVRCTDFSTTGQDGAPGKVIVSARTTWAMIDRESGRIMRVPPDVTRRFR